VSFFISFLDKQKRKNRKISNYLLQNPQSAITEGQFVAWYLQDELLGSGVIS